MILNKETPH